ncbi:MAG: hypothetical protein AAF927_06265 [Bacteroidota bacterium]
MQHLPPYLPIKRRKSRSFKGFDKKSQAFDKLIQDYDDFETRLDQAADYGIISAPPQEGGAYDMESQRIQLYTLASRLSLLGYIKARRVKSQKHVEKNLDLVKAAIRQFQKEAGLNIDPNIGDETWYKLDELVSFESKFDKGFWFQDDLINPRREKALLRALQLRLWALGLSRFKPDDKFEHLTKRPFSSLKRILVIFSATHLIDEVGLNFQTLNLLFDQDLLSQLVSRVASKDKKKFRLNLSTNSRDRFLADKFLVNMAKIELWLLGFKIKIDGQNDYSNLQGTNASYKDSDLFEAMRDFYQHFENRSLQEAQRLAASFSPQLFIKIAEINETPIEDREDASALILEKLDTDEKIDDAWGHIKEKGMRLWDGIKRVFRLIKKKGKKAFDFIKANLFKGFYRISSKAFKIVKKGISELVRSIGVYIKGELFVPNVHFKFSKDLDTRVTIDSSAQKADFDTALQSLQTQTVAFRVSCQIFSWVLKTSINLATSVVGWAKFLYSLVKAYPELKKLYQDFKSLGID